MSAIADDRAGRAALAPGDTPADPMPRGIALSAVLHLGVLILVVLGVPSLFRAAPVEETPIAVELVTIAPKTHATRINRFRPTAKAKPEPAERPPAPIPERKPEPMQSSAEAPSSVAPPPPPPPPPERTEQVRREPHEKPPPPPPMKPVEARTEPMPPPPEPKPRPRHEPHREARAPRRPEPRKQETAAFDKLLDRLEEQPKKPQPASFDSLLKNLTRDAPAPEDDTPPRPQRAAASDTPSSQPRAPLGSQLTASEIDLLRQQIERCWVVPAGARDAKDLDIEIKAVVNPDGTVREAAIVNMARYASDPFFRAAADSAKRAVLNPQCSPLRLPPDKYEAWHNLDLFFNPKDLL